MIDKLKSMVASLGADSKHDDIAAVVVYRDAVKKAFLDASDMVDLLIEEWVKENGPIVIGDTRYYIGTVTDVKCVDVGEAARSLLESGGVEALVQCLASGAIKHGAARQVMDGEVFAKVFKAETRQDLKTGAPLKRVMKSNSFGG